MITLYGFGETRSFRALWALEEAALEYSYVPVQFGSDQGPAGALSNEYRQLNPQGKVPTLLHDDIRLTESGAILNYIATLAALGSESSASANAPETPLIPEQLHLRARYDEVCFFVLTDLEQPLWTTGKHRFALPRPQRVPDVLETARWEFDKALVALGRHMADCEYAVGGNFTMADILIAQTLRWADRFELTVPTEFMEYQQRMYDRPACQKAMAIAVS